MSGNLRAAQITDGLLKLAQKREATGIRLVPCDPAVNPDAHRAEFLRGDHVVASYLLHQPVSDAVIFRLTLMAGLDVALHRPQTGHCQVGSFDSSTKLFVYRSTESEGTSISAWLLRNPELRSATGSTKPAAPLPDVLSPGTKIANHRIVKLIGRGGMGEVYRARHDGLQVDTAIKVLRRGVLAEAPHSVSQFFTEARAAARIRHPGIISVYDVSVLSDGRPYLAMELLDGESLRSLLEVEEALHPRRAVSMAAQIAAALQAVHDRGVVHRDVSVGNIFVLGEPPNETLKLVDFGTANLDGCVAPDEEGDDGMVYGTPYYISPEQATGQPVDGRADLYSLGAVLYEMISGEPPFDGETAAEIVLQQVYSPPPPLTSPWGEVSPALSQLVRRLLMKSPDQRFSRAVDVLLSLAQVHA